MVDSKMDPVSNILGIDKVNMDGKLILIEERHNSNANFVLNSVILNALSDNNGICFVLFHNTFNHYHNVGMKFGYNLKVLKAEGKVNIIEPMKIIGSNMESRNNEETCKLHETSIKEISDVTNSISDSLFRIIKNEYYEMKKYHKNVIIVIDDMSHLYNLGFTLRESMCYLKLLRSLIECDNTSQLCVAIHTYDDKLQNCMANIAVPILKYMAHLFVMIDSFETGYSSDVSGKITINWRIDHIRKEHNWSEISRYIYKVSDRQVKIYSPGQ
ncbi:elongator complex protein 6 [Megalopta genalis]|uniref:elongator complex protein 6 n=1 Tax=Megalopta genalis TaxID=115081 RepID=UPI0014437AB5|nr:elongator complex protein 6 [Megalopta genalis]XP_033329195.1 elongator complex protein 6 [Megalopta genalis]